MQTYIVFIALLALTYLGFKMGRARAVTASEGRLSVLHSLPAYHGFLSLSGAAFLRSCLLRFGSFWSPRCHRPRRLRPRDMQNLSEARLNLLLNDIRNVATGNIASGEPEPAIIAAAGATTTCSQRVPPPNSSSRCASPSRALPWDAAISKRIFGPQHCGT